MSKYKCTETRCRELVLCYSCLNALKARHNAMLEFIKSIEKTDTFSTANHWNLYQEVEKLLREIGELNENN